MKLVFYTNAHFQSDGVFGYIYARVAERFSDSAVVAVHSRQKQGTVFEGLKRLRRKVKRLGFVSTLDIASSYPMATVILRRQQREVDRQLRLLWRPDISPQPGSQLFVETVNGPDAVEAITRLQPDVLLQCGAGILRPQIFNIPRLACLNMHHGIAPLIRGMGSINWALWENRPEWIGATIHRIDAGIDTGEVLAYAPVTRLCKCEGFPSLFVRATQKGVDQMLSVLTRLEAGDRWRETPPQGPRVYRSTLSGWRLGALELRLAMRRWIHGHRRPNAIPAKNLE